MRRVMLWAVLGGAASLIGAFGGCSASGNELPEDEEGVVPDGGHRQVVSHEDDPFDGATANYDAPVVFDSGTPVKTDSGPPAPQCSFQAGSQGGSCPTATDLGSVSGDTDPSQNSVAFTGSTSQWLVVSATEDSNSVVEHDLSVKLTLNAPAGSNYDLYAYVDPSGTPSSRSCQTVSGQSTNAAGVADEVTLTWDDNQISQPNDDTRLVTVKVEHVSGPCGPGNEWSLSVEGHPQ
jgi:hypothetical protein